MATITVNGVKREVQAPGDTPLLYVLRNDLELIGPQFGCGLAQCGACSVLIDGKEVRSCITALSDVAPNQEITTLEGLPARWAKQKGLSAEEAKTTLHPVQQAWIEEQTPQCGFCQNGMMIKATELLESNANPDADANQRGVHHVRRIAESVPLRNLHRDHRSRTTCRHDHGEGEVSDGDHERKTRKCFRSDSDPAPIREDRWRACRGLQPGWHGASEGRYPEGRDDEELARSQPRRVRGSRFTRTTRS